MPTNLVRWIWYLHCWVCPISKPLIALLVIGSRKWIGTGCLVEKGFPRRGTYWFWMSSAGNGGDTGQPADLDRGRNAPAFESIPNNQIWCREPRPLLTDYVRLEKSKTKNGKVILLWNQVGGNGLGRSHVQCKLQLARPHAPIIIFSPFPNLLPNTPTFVRAHWNHLSQ